MVDCDLGVGSGRNPVNNGGLGVLKGPISRVGGNGVMLHAKGSVRSLPRQTDLTLDDALARYFKDEVSIVVWW